MRTLTRSLTLQASSDVQMKFFIAITSLLLAASAADAGVVRLRIERREPVLNGRAFGAAGAYEKLVGKVEFALDPNNTRNDVIVDLKLAARKARGSAAVSRVATGSFSRECVAAPSP